MMEAVVSCTVVSKLVVYRTAGMKGRGINNQNMSWIGMSSWSKMKGQQGPEGRGQNRVRDCVRDKGGLDVHRRR